MFGKEINFDRFVRGLIFMTVLVAGYFLVCYLSPVLVPFVVAWAFAYILYPVVNFFQYKCRFHFRMLSILVTLVIVIGIISTLLYLAIPVMLEELLHLKDVAIAYVSGGTGADSLPEVVQKFIRENSDKLRIERLLNEKDLMSGLKEALPRVWNMLLSTANVLISIVSSLIALLYLVFMLNDYDRVKKGWIRFVPKSKRSMAKKIVSDIDNGMSGYFRGQALVALANCVLFSVGFMIIGFPMPVGLGVFIGLISFIPYVQLLGFFPATVLAILCSVDTGRNFWMLMLGVIAVYCIVQVLQDSIITPHPNYTPIYFLKVARGYHSRYSKHSHGNHCYCIGIYSGYFIEHPQKYGNYKSYGYYYGAPIMSYFAFYIEIYCMLFEREKFFKQKP